MNEIKRLKQKLSDGLKNVKVMPVQEEQQIIENMIKKKNGMIQKHRSDIAQLQEKNEWIESEIEQNMKLK